IEYIKGAFELKAVEFKQILKMGRTQLQDAVPMTVGQEFHAWAVTLNEEIRALQYTSKLLLEVNLGATAIGTGLNTAPGYQA
ncbi:aspartate ammonia-lyase, partial [Escherichia coli]